MASVTLIPVSEYLHSSYRPDCDYIDGELQERNVGEHSHATLQGLLATLFNIHRREWNIRTATELRVQTQRHRYRIPDVCVMRRSDPVERIIITAPLICIEILSPEDRINRMQERFADYAAMGVANLWLIDPVSRHAWTVLPDGSQQRVHEAFSVPETPIRIELAEVWAEFDDMQSQD